MTQVNPHKIQTGGMSLLKSLRKVDDWTISYQKAIKGMKEMIREQSKQFALNTRRAKK